MVAAPASIGTNALSEPSLWIRNSEMLLSATLTTYRKFPVGSAAVTPGPMPVLNGEFATGIRTPLAASMEYAETLSSRLLVT